jgi:uncharacterized protein YkwD
MAGTRAALPDATTDAFVQEALNGANAYRSKHHAPLLVTDDGLMAYAKARAASRSEYEGLSAGHADLRDGTGENIYWGGGSSATPKTGGDATTSWYKEISAYDWNNPPGTQGVTGHFTQLVWMESTKVGIGRVAGQGAKYYETYIVFVFETPGNYEGEYKTNVLPA